MIHYFIEKFLAFIEFTGNKFLRSVEDTGFVIVLFAESVFYTKNAFGKRREIFKQMYIAGVKSLLVCSIVSLFTGMILALQAGIEFASYQQEAMVGNLVIATMTREMGPFTAAMVLTASVGSAMAAELGTMKVSEEIDALEMMAISPVKFLVMPRVIALSIMLPVVTVYVVVLGTLGGGVVANYQLLVSYDLYYEHVLESLQFKATYVGLFKAYVFGIIISCVSCAQGLKAQNGAIGVGHATRTSVIISFLMILIVGYIITSLFYGKAL
jgi:phospholipid/cholesterol/gamma-HCH transport system permease protein